MRHFLKRKAIHDRVVSHPDPRETEQALRRNRLKTHHRQRKNSHRKPNDPSRPGHVPPNENRFILVLLHQATKPPSWARRKPPKHGRRRLFQGRFVQIARGKDEGHQEPFLAKSRYEENADDREAAGGEGKDQETNRGRKSAPGDAFDPGGRRRGHEGEAGRDSGGLKAGGDVVRSSGENDPRHPREPDQIVPAGHRENAPRQGGAQRAARKAARISAHLRAAQGEQAQKQADAADREQAAEGGVRALRTEQGAGHLRHPGLVRRLQRPEVLRGAGRDQGGAGGDEVPADNRGAIPGHRDPLAEGRELRAVRRAAAAATSQQGFPHLFPVQQPLVPDREHNNREP